MSKKKSSISEFSFCMDDEIAGAYPQAAPKKANGDFIDEGVLYFDHFPKPAGDPIKLKMQSGAKWTGVMSASHKFLCLLVDAEALEIFKKFELGNVGYFDAVVSKSKTKKDYTYIFVCNHVTIDDVDFARSQCFLVDMISEPLGKIKIADKADYAKKVEQANEGTLPKSEPFCRITFGKIQLRSGHEPKADIFGMSQLGSRIYVSNALRDAILEAEISGCEFSKNTELIF